MEHNDGAMEDETGAKKPCHCLVCNGKLRNRKTIKKHMQRIALDEIGSEEAQEVNYVETDQHFFATSAASYNNQGTLHAGNLGEDDSHSDSSGHSENDDTPEHMNDGCVAEEPINIPDEKLRDFILRALISKGHYGWSQEETMAQIRNFFEVTEDNRLPHKNWPSVISFLKTLGYREPRHYKICCSEDHVTLLEPRTPCLDCGKDWIKCHDYYVLGIHLEDIFLDSKTIEDHLAHWKEREQWLGRRSPDVRYKEVWNGQRFTDLSYFWDSATESLLPTICVYCGSIITTSEIIEAVQPGSALTDPVSLRCSECMTTFNHIRQFMKGSPLNQAFIFHEDGFNAFVKKSRGVATIQLSSACTFKEKRSKGYNMNVYSFIPICKIGEGIPHKLDAFLKPLIDEVVDLYINGKKIIISNPIQIGNDVINAGEYQVRMLLLLGTADLKAHAEMTLYAGGGKIGCRKCLVTGTFIPQKRHYYYHGITTKWTRSGQFGQNGVCQKGQTLLVF